ncbi:MAG: universal stress protein [Deltaproteobacteria bacterium]|nr:universal stress protein [Kofleriaceae bacterium]
MAIVCGTDLSDLSRGAHAAALALARRRGDKDLVLVTVVDPDVAGQDAERKAADVKRRLDEVIASFGDGSGLRVRGDVIVGPTIPSLVAATETEGGDLLVVASKGHSNSPLMKLGGISEGVVVAASVPVLVVRDAAPFEAWARGERALRVMLGLDDSASCEPALALLRRLRGYGPVDVIAAHVYYADEAARRYGVKTKSMVESDPEIERLLVRDLERRLGALDGEGQVLFRPRCGLGRIGDHLLEVADGESVDVILVGTRQKGGIGRLSSVSSLILHDAKQSVWCVPASAHLGRLQVPRFRVAVVATDLSDFGNHAVPYGYTLVGERGGEVHLLHVRDEDHEGADVADIERRLLALVPPKQQHVTTRVEVVTGDETAQLIGEAAERLGADVVVIASRGRSGIARALLGSVADKLLRTCRRPVLVLRPPTE